ncbi:hypothetical protein BH18THE1_BH18THE1_09930 [soil metagenome]
MDKINLVNLLSSSIKVFGSTIKRMGLAKSQGQIIRNYSNMTSLYYRLG